MLILDVSHNQGAIEWHNVAKVADSVYIKATEGQTFIDPKFLSYAAGAFEAGLKVGFYHMSTLNQKSDITGDALQEASFFLNTLKKAPANTLPLMLDVEKNIAGLSPHAVMEWMQAFLAVLHSNGHNDPLIYSYFWFLNAGLPQGHPFGKYRLWIADYQPPYQIPHGWDKAYMWQYSNVGVVEGIQNKVDLNKFV